MANGRFISYLRVSTRRQGESGLGLEAQRRAVSDFLNGGNWTLIQELVEVESGKRNDRVKLAEALKLCRLHNATLVIAKLDRLSRDAAFLMNLQAAGIKFVAADMPEANEMVVGVMALVAQWERKAISARTKAALAEAKAKGKRLGRRPGEGNVMTDAMRMVASVTVTAKANERATLVAETVREIQAEGAASLRQIAAGLNARSIPTPRGGEWSAVQVQRLLARI